MKISINIFILLIISFFSANGFKQSDITGDWITAKNNIGVKIYTQKIILYWKVVSSDDSESKIGEMIIRDINIVEGDWKGEVYSPKREEWYDAQFYRNNNKLNVVIIVDFFCKTVVWTKK